MQCRLFVSGARSVVTRVCGFDAAQQKARHKLNGFAPARYHAIPNRSVAIAFDMWSRNQTNTRDLARVRIVCVLKNLTGE